MAPKALSWLYGSKEDLFTFNLKYLYYAGLWPGDNMSREGKILYKLYEVTLHIFSVMFLAAVAVGAYERRDNITVLLANLDKGLVGCNFVGKVVFFVSKRRELKLLIDQILDSEDTVSENCKIRMVKHALIVTGLMTAVTGAFSCLALYHGEMTIDAWMPFDPHRSTMNLFLAAQVLVVLFVVPCGYRGFAMQGIICSIIMYFCEQLDGLRMNLKELEYTEEYDAEVRCAFKKIVDKHVRMIRYSKAMKGICEEYFLIQNVAITVELCLNAMMVTLYGSEQKSLLASFMAFLSCALLNAYTYCYLGNELILKSQAIAAAAYESNWPTWPVDLQKNLLTVITVAQRPLKLSAGAVVPMSLQTFGQALYNGYSIFAVLSDAVN